MSTTKKIVTRFDPPPIPYRGYDWEATLADYDPENDDPRGFGRTEQEAIDSLQEAIDMRAGEDE